MRRDKNQLKAQVAALSKDTQKGQCFKETEDVSLHGMGHDDSSIYEESETKRSISEGNFELALRSEIRVLREELAANMKQLESLRRKLDLELELKWERSRGPFREQRYGSRRSQSFVNRLTNLVAPYPIEPNYDEILSNFNVCRDSNEKKTKGSGDVAKLAEYDQVNGKTVEDSDCEDYLIKEIPFEKPQ